MARSYFTVHDPTGMIQISPPISDYYKIERSRAEMQIGQAVFLLPLSYSGLFLLGNDLRTDAQIRIFRSIADGPAVLDLDTFWFVQEASEIQDNSGREYIEVRAIDAIGLLDRRVVPYDTTDTQSDKTGPAGNLMKAFVRENFGALATDVSRDLSVYLTVAADTSDGATIDVAVQRPKVLEAIREAANISAKQGSYISFDIICNPVNGMMEFRTYPNFRGNDHRVTSAAPVLVGRNRGNLINVKLTYSSSEEVNYIYAVGGGIGSVKITSERSDAARVLVSPFNRREYILNDGNEIDTVILDDQSDNYIRAHRTKFGITGDLIEIDGFSYNINYGFGDYLTLDDKNNNFNIRLSAISILDENGETIKASLVGDTV